MSDHSHIAWTHTTWNPIVGCQKVSAGCAHCYAVQDAHRMAGNPHPTIHHAYAGLTHDNGHLDWTGVVRLLPDRLDQPIRWKHPRMIFVNSMGDWMHAHVPTWFLDRMLEVMAACSHHIFQTLTKRPDHLAMQLYGVSLSHPLRILGGGDYVSNVWIGVSVEDQDTADVRLPILYALPGGWLKWVSLEPLLAEVDLTPYLPWLQWVVIGGESGHDARYCDPDWVWGLLRQCHQYSPPVPVFLKQMGSWWASTHKAHNPKGGDPYEWPSELRIRQYPSLMAQETIHAY